MQNNQHTPKQDFSGFEVIVPNRIFCANVKNISKIALNILEKKERIFVLSGAVGSGKTALIQAILSSMGGEFLAVSSPTFGIRHEYGRVGKKPQSTNNEASKDESKSVDKEKYENKYEEVYHYDLYNVDLYEVLELGLLEWLSQDGWHFIEWGEQVLPLLKSSGFECVEVSIAESLDFLDEMIGDKDNAECKKKAIQCSAKFDFRAHCCRFYKISP